MLDGTTEPVKIAHLYGYEGLDRVKIDRAGPGDIVAVAGFEEIEIGETIADPDNPVALPAIQIDEPTLAMVFTTNTSPMAGREGNHVTSRKLRDRLVKEDRLNVAIRVSDLGGVGYEVAGRGELQLAILVETMRREGFELSVGKPTILTRPGPDGPEEPMERLSIDCPEECVGAVTRQLGPRRGKMLKMVNHGSGRGDAAVRESTSECTEIVAVSAQD